MENIVNIGDISLFQEISIHVLYEVVASLNRLWSEPHSSIHRVGFKKIRFFSNQTV